MLSQSLKIKYFYAKLLLITQYYSHCAKDWFHFFFHHKMAPLNCIEEKNYANVSPWQYDLDFSILPCKTIIKKKD